MNPVRGEVALVVGDMTYKLKLTTGAICAAEAEGKKAFLQMMAEAHWFVHARIMLKAALQRFHPKSDDKLCDAIIDEVGINRVVEVVIEAFKAAFPQEDATKAADKADP